MTTIRTALRCGWIAVSDPLADRDMSANHPTSSRDG